MNRIYKIIWSKTRNCYVVVSEMAKRSGKRSSGFAKKMLVTSILAGALVGNGMGTVHAAFHHGNDDGNVNPAQDRITAEAADVAWLNALKEGNGGLELKANIDASNVTTYSVDWGKAIGTGAIAADDEKLVSGKTVYAALQNLQAGEGVHDYHVNSTTPESDTNYNNTGAIGDNALAAGVSAKAEGIASTAVGYNAHAKGGTALAVGTSVTATGNQSVAIGTSANAEKDSSIAIGTGVSAKGPNSIAIGTGVTAEGQGAIALGSNGASAKGNGSMAFGQGSTAEGDYSTAFGGGGARATATAATAFGVQTHAATNQSTAFGYGTYAGGLVTGTSINRGIRGGVPSKGYFYVKNGNTSVRVDENKRELYVFRNEAATLYGGQFVYKSDKGNPIVIDSNGKIYNVKADSDGNLLRDTLNTTDKIVTLSGEFLEDTKVSNATAWGEGTKAINYQATAWGAHTLARGANSTVWGAGSQATGDISTAWGTNNIASGANSTAFGGANIASGSQSTAFGHNTQAMEDAATSFGANTIARGHSATAFGEAAQALSQHATAWGLNTRAMGVNSTAFTENSIASGYGATAFGQNTIATSVLGTSWGEGTSAGGGFYLNGVPVRTSGSLIHGSSLYTQDGKYIGYAKLKDSYYTSFDITYSPNWTGGKVSWYGGGGNATTAFGHYTMATGVTATAFGWETRATNNQTTAFGKGTVASGDTATAFGAGSTASGTTSLAFGNGTAAKAQASTAWGINTIADQIASTSFGYRSIANASYATAFGDSTKALGERSTSFGGYTIADGTYSTAWGSNTSAMQNAATVWGTGSVAYGPNATSFGHNTAAIGQSAVSWGHNSIAGNAKYNGQNVLLQQDYTSYNWQTGGMTYKYSVVDPKTYATLKTVEFEVLNSDSSISGKFQDALRKSGITIEGYGATAFGQNTVASGEMSTAFGQKTMASGGASTAFGQNTKAEKWVDTAFGSETTASGGASTAFGAGTQAKGWADTSFGQNTVAQGGASTAFGAETLATGWTDTALGQGSHARGGAGIAAGQGSMSYGWSSVAFGAGSVAASGNSLAALGGHTGGWYWDNENGFGVEEGKGYGSVSIGEGSQAYENYTYAIGQKALTGAKAANAIAIGNGAETVRWDNDAGDFAAIDSALAIGTNAKADATDAISIGHGSEVYGEKSIAIGTGNKIYGAKSSVIGDPNTLSGEDNHAHGNDNNIYVDHGYILGSESSVGLTSSVALGYQSATGDTLYATPSMTVNGTKYDFAGGAPVGTVSVGAEGKERTITNVAAGRISATSTDAINGSQLYFAIQALNEKVVVESGDSSVNVDSKVEPEDAAGAGTTGSGTTTGGNTDAGNTESGSTTGGNDTTTTGGNTGATAGGDSGEIEPTRTTTYIVTANTTTAEAGSDNLTVEDSNPGGDDKTHHYTIDLAKDIHVTNVTVDNSVKVGDKTTIEGDQITTNTVNGDTINTNTINLGDTTIEEGDDNHITYKKGGNTYNIATVEDGMDYAGDDGKAIHKNLAEQLDIVGGAADKASEYNIYTYNDGDKLRINLAKDIKGVDSVTVNKTVKVGDKTTIEGDKITVGDTVIEGDQITTKTVKAGDTTINNDGLTIKNGPSVTKNGIDAGGKKITNVAPGTDDTDAVNVSQLREANQDIYNSMNRLDNSTRKGIAGAAALAALHPLDFDPDDKWEFSAGVGNYRGETAAAIGAFYHPNDDTIFSLGATVGNGENLVNGGVTFRFGQKNHQSRSKKAMAKEIVELRAEVAELKAMVYSMANGRMPGLDLTKSEEFPDTPENHWAYDYVSVLAGNGVLEGYQDGFFKGDRTLTRYEMAAIIYRAMMKGVDVDERMKEEFAPELARVKVDTLTSHSDGTPSIQRVRVIKGRE